MKSLKITHLKPNPTGKDRGLNASMNQLAGEWVDIYNDGTEPYSLNNVVLYHMKYQAGCSNGAFDAVRALNGILPVGKTVRVHSGKTIPTFQMQAQDIVGADFHEFTHKNFIWNNDCGDKAGLWDGLVWIDQTSYGPYPEEGRILARRVEQLI